MALSFQSYISLILTELEKLGLQVEWINLIIFQSYISLILTSDIVAMVDLAFALFQSYISLILTNVIYKGAVSKNYLSILH